MVRDGTRTFRFNVSMVGVVVRGSVAAGGSAGGRNGRTAKRSQHCRSRRRSAEGRLDAGGVGDVVKRSGEASRSHILHRHNHQPPWLERKLPSSTCPRALEHLASPLYLPRHRRNVASTTNPRSFSLLQLCCQNHSFCYFSPFCELPRIPAHLRRRPETTMSSSAIPGRSAIPSFSFLALSLNPFMTTKIYLLGYMSVSTSRRV